AALDSQLAALDHVQRWSRDKVVPMFMVDGRDFRAFPNHTPELLAGRLEIVPDGSTGTIRCDIVLHRGRISSLEFSTPPSALLRGPFRIRRARLLADPLAAAPPAGEAPAATPV